MRTKNRDEFGNPINPALEQSKEEYRRTHQADIAPQGKPLGGLSALDDMLGNPSSIPRKDQEDYQRQAENVARKSQLQRQIQKQLNPEGQGNPQNGLDLARKIANQNDQRIMAAQARADAFRNKMEGAQTPRFNELRKKLR